MSATGPTTPGSEWMRGKPNDSWFYTLTNTERTELTQKLADGSERDGDCLRWLGVHTKPGYGNVFWHGKNLRVHRAAYLLHVGPIPNEFQIDHLCRVRDCLEPTHLEAVENRTNSLRGIGPTAINAARTHCIHGHEFDEANTYWRTDGHRECRECTRRRGRAYNPKRKRAS